MPLKACSPILLRSFHFFESPTFLQRHRSKEEIKKPHSKKKKKKDEPYGNKHPERGSNLEQIEEDEDDGIDDFQVQEGDQDEDKPPDDICEGTLLV